MKIKTKFLLIFLSFGIIIGGVVAYFAISSRTNIVTHVNQISNSSILELESVTQIANIFDNIELLFTEYLHEVKGMHTREIALTKQKLLLSFKKFEDKLEERKKLTTAGRAFYVSGKIRNEDDEIIAINTIEDKYRSYQKSIRETIAGYEKTGSVGYRTDMGQFKEEGEALAAEIELFKSNSEEEVMDATIDVNTATNKSIIYLLVFVISTIVAGIIAGILMANSIVNPILKLNTAVKNNELEAYRIKDVGATDEIGLLAASLIQMDMALKKSREQIEDNNRSLEQKIEKRTQEIVTKNDELQLLMQSSSSVLWRLKADDFSMLYVSENITELLGYTVDEMMAENFWIDNLHRKDSATVLAGVSVAIETGFLRLQFRFKHKNGTFPWMQADIKCLYDEQGKPYEFVGNWWDVTKQREMEDLLKTSNERFELAFKASNDVIYDRNLLTNTQWASDELFNSFGYTMNSSSDPQWWKEKIHPDDYEGTMQAIRQGKKEKRITWTGNYRFRKADGTYADVIDRLYMLYDPQGNPVRSIGSLLDVTHLKKTESDLNSALIKANESALAKSEFLANMSHEIRTPLNGIVGMTDLALDTDLTAEQRRYLDTIRISGDSLMSLINDILDFSKIDAGKLDITPVEFSMRDSISAILQPLGLKASLKKLEFIFSIKNNVPDLWFADVHRLHQIITNLAGNAIKFTEKGEVVLAIELKSLQHDEATLLFSVSDTGIGIPGHKLNLIFEEFIQADGSTTRKYGGTGLGLTITKRLVELMGGKIEVQSKVGAGSVFSFTLKLKLQKDHQQYFVPQHNLENTRVLVVEDNLSTREGMVEMLQSFRMKPLAVESGEEAIIEIKKSAAAGDPYSLILLDISLKGKMDGFDVVEIIKADTEIKQTNIIVISMSQQASDRERFALLGVEQYFTKPFSQSDLLDCIQDTLTGMSLPVEKIHPVSISIPITLNNSENYKILLVEDNLVNQEVATSMLVRKGHNVVIAGNGEEAVSLYKSEFFDLILMDIQMPLLNGYEATHKIRIHESNTGRHTPIIGLTANAMKGDREKCLEAGMDDYVSKPVRFADLIAAVDRVKQNLNITKEVKVEKLQLVNLDQLINNLDGDTEMVQNILENFESLALQYMEAIEENAALGNIAEIILPAHTIKGQCMHVEMNTVIELAGKVELLARENSIAELLPLIPVLKSALMEGVEALQHARDKLLKQQVAYVEPGY